MNKVDRLLKKVRSKPTINEKMENNNPYMSKDYNILLSYLEPEHERPKNMKKFLWALMIHSDEMIPVGGDDNG